VVGGGRRLHLWHDVWFESISLKKIFLSLFLVAEDKDASTWRCISVGCKCFSGYIKFGLGDGRSIQFWHDDWCEETTLKELHL
jgi:hypothetical protein